MSFEYVRPIPTVDEIRNLIPLSSELAKVKKERDESIGKVMTGDDDRFIVIIGPCSAHDEEAVCEYVLRLAKVQEKVKEKLLLIPRIYTNKPRTTGIGYKGMAHMPDPTGEPDMVEGMKAIRRMHIRALKESALTAADEMLYPGNYPYLEDVLSYVAVGARSVENQQHRLTCSGLDIPCGMKNPTSGYYDVMFNAITAAQAPHSFIYNGHEVKTLGNPYTHAILRGWADHYGVNIPNYHFESLYRVAETYLAKGMNNPAVIVDANHSNSNKVFSEQPRIVGEVMRSRENSDMLKKLVKGIMVESYLVEGAQSVSEGVYGKSITDPCLGWDESERLLLGLAESL